MERGGGRAAPGEGGPGQVAAAPVGRFREAEDEEEDSGPTHMIWGRVEDTFAQLPEGCEAQLLNFSRNSASAWVPPVRPNSYSQEGLCPALLSIPSGGLDSCRATSANRDILVIVGTGRPAVEMRLQSFSKHVIWESDDSGTLSDGTTDEEEEAKEEAVLSSQPYVTAPCTPCFFKGCEVGKPCVYCSMPLKEATGEQEKKRKTKALRRWLHHKKIMERATRQEKVGRQIAHMAPTAMPTLVRSAAPTNTLVMTLPRRIRPAPPPGVHLPGMHWVQPR